MDKEDKSRITMDASTPIQSISNQRPTIQNRPFRKRIEKESGVKSDGRKDAT
jgi:hypothetical protein